MGWPLVYSVILSKGLCLSGRHLWQLRSSRIPSASLPGPSGETAPTHGPHVAAPYALAHALPPGSFLRKQIRVCAHSHCVVKIPLPLPTRPSSSCTQEHPRTRVHTQCTFARTLPLLRPQPPRKLSLKEERDSGGRLPAASASSSSPATHIGSSWGWPEQALVLVSSSTPLFTT